jgi:hypothetical protein
MFDACTACVLYIHLEKAHGPPHVLRFRTENSTQKEQIMSEHEVVANQKTILDHQATILENQKTIQGHQGSILENQKTILKNQANIEKNQDALQEILKNQKEILAALKK